MATRNYQIEADIDGRKTTLTGGPGAKDGGMDIRLHQRANGQRYAATTRIYCQPPNERGELIVTIYPPDSTDPNTPVDVRHITTTRHAITIRTQR